MIQNKTTYTRLLCGLIALFVVSVIIAAPAPSNAAACLPGLPCVTDKTPNDPWDDILSPNQSGAPNASKSTLDTCDADFMNQIYARAALEAERENVMIESIISKPDSVLEYSCFETILNTAAYHAAPIFSETKDFSTANGGALATVELDGVLDDMYEPEPNASIQNDPIDDLEIEVYMGEGHMSNVLQNLVLASLKDASDPNAPTYIDANFSHTFMGGQPVGLNNNFTGEMDPNPAYVCAQMNLTWMLAKCQNADVPAGFFDMGELAGLDPRIYPQACPDPSGDGVGSMITPEMIALADNVLGQYSAYDSTQFVNLSGGRTYEDFLSADACLPPVPTGVVVKTYDSSIGIFGNVTTDVDTHDEYLCVNPGCYYDKDTSQCRKVP
ncbi:MAG: hypothetical protein KDJ35_01530 [Alphaproteobacteria bacterium]|nr:hypothetical protein [Alphaproteobacteria bacterium]